MAWMDSNIDVETSVRGGLLSGVKRAIGGGESFFQNTYTARGSPGTIGLGPGAARGHPSLRDGRR